MNVKFVNTIIFVKDISRSKHLYSKILGQKIVHDYETIIMYENGLVIHDAQSITNTIFKGRPAVNRDKMGEKNILIYFETDNLEEAHDRIRQTGLEIIHEIEKQEWGQQVFRFYDYDNHIIEIGEQFRLDNI